MNYCMEWTVLFPWSQQVLIVNNDRPCTRRAVSWMLMHYNAFEGTLSYNYVWAGE